MNARIDKTPRFRRLQQPPEDPAAADALLRRLQQVLGMGKPLDQATRRNMEQRFSRDLGDVRIHDSRQAVELARRLGAEAFTMGSHIFGPAEKLNEETPQGSGLLAHELTHVIQQTSPGLLSQSNAELTKPGDQSTETPSEGNGETGKTPRLPQSAAPRYGSGARRNVPTPAAGRISLEAPALPVQRTRESEAQANEHLMKSEMEGTGTPPAESRSQAPQVDPEELAHKVYHLMLQDVRLERERGVAGR